jgi:hypothetical protein
VVERRRQRSDPAPGTRSPAPESPDFGYPRRTLSPPVNDNRPAALRGMLGIAILAAIGCALAWFLSAWLG